MFPFGAVQVGQIKISKWAKLEYRTQKAADQGEHPSIQHALDTERGARVPWVGGCAQGSKGTEGDEVHRLTSPSDSRAAPGQLLRPEAKGRTWSGRRHLAGV